MFVIVVWFVLMIAVFDGSLLVVLRFAWLFAIVGALLAIPMFWVLFGMPITILVAFGFILMDCMLLMIDDLLCLPY